MRTRIVLMVTAGLLVSGCTGAEPAAGPRVPVFTPSAPVTSVTSAKAVPRTCGGIATVGEVTDILGAAVTGQTLPIVGVPEPKIGRTARIDCYYGVPDGLPVSAAAVTIGLASYVDRPAAQRRMTSTVETEREAGAKASDVPVGPDRGVLLNGEKSTLVAVRDNNTVVVIVAPTVIAPDQAGSLLARLADRALTPR